MEADLSGLQRSSDNRVGLCPQQMDPKRTRVHIRGGDGEQTELTKQSESAERRIEEVDC